ncbi:MAG: hypothetical protein ACO3B3_09485 [Cyanobium sp.]
MVLRRNRADDRPPRFDDDAEDPAVRVDRERGDGHEPERHSRGVWGCLPWLVASLALLGGGFYWGYQFRAAQKLSADELKERERQELRTLGWQTSADGVLTRWCTEECHPPKLFGGGMARIFEVYCKERPCGAIRATFRVLDRDGKEVGTTTASKDGLQGERLRLVVVSPEPQAQRFELKEFVAQAMVY